MPNRMKKDPLKEIEETQAELRKSIEQSRELAQKSQELLDRHKDELKDRE
jgi:hypothetical protein